MAEVMIVVIGAIGIVGFLGLLIALSAMFNGWVFATLWLWFIVPVFHLPVLGIAQAIGVAFVWSCLQAHPKKDDKEDVKKTAKHLGTSWVSKLILLGVAYLLKTWFM